MANTQNIVELLNEAMVMLDDAQTNMGMFQRQQYGKLKRLFDKRLEQDEELRRMLTEIKQR